MIHALGIQHIGLIVPDVRKAEQWYTETMGFARKGEFHTASGIHAVFVRSDTLDVMYELIQHPQGSDIQRRAEVCGGWMDHIAYETEDLEAEMEHAKKLGALIIEGIVDVPEFWDNGFRYFLLRAPGGEKVEFCKVL